MFRVGPVINLTGIVLIEGHFYSLGTGVPGTNGCGIPEWTVEPGSH